MEKISSNPMDYINAWDFAILILGVVLRLYKSALSHNVHKHGEYFSWKKYFDLKHRVRWIVHLSVSIIALLTLPQLFVGYIQPKYAPGFDFWALSGSGLLGWFGYDLVKIIGGVLGYIGGKIGIK